MFMIGRGLIRQCPESYDGHPLLEMPELLWVHYKLVCKSRIKAMSSWDGYDMLSSSGHILSQVIKGHTHMSSTPNTRHWQAKAQEVNSWWNSTHDMWCSSIASIPISATMSEMKWTYLLPKDTECRLLEEMLQVLKPFKNVMVQVSADEYVTTSAIQPHWEWRI